MKKLMILLLIAAPVFGADFVFYGSGQTLEATSLMKDGQQAAVTLPSGLPVDEMYLMWPTNASGYGTPVAINKTEAWWVGPDTVPSNRVFSVYGRNLSLGGQECYLYYSNTSTAATGWLTSQSENPYKADFSFTNIANGTYAIMAHNGRGRKYGYSDPLTVTVRAPDQWDENVNNWISVADGAALQAAINTADGTDWTTLYLENSLYEIPATLDFDGVDYVRIVGSGMNNTLIKPSIAFSGGSLITGFDVSHIRIENLELEASALITSDFVNIEKATDIEFVNMRLDHRSADVTWSGPEMIPLDKCVFLQNATNILFSGCEAELKGDINLWYCSQMLMTNCNLKGTYDTARLVGLFRMTDSTSFADNTFQNYDYSDYDNAASRCMGRAMNAGGALRNCYWGGNTITNMAPHASSPDSNVGEHFMFEFARTHYDGTPESAGSDNILFPVSPDIDDVKNGLYMRDIGIIVVTSGKGIGQYRHITDIIGNTVYVDKPWAVIPDATSYCVIGSYSDHVAIYDNIHDGVPHVIESSTDYSSCAVLVFGACLGMVYDGNTLSDLRHPIKLSSLDTASGSLNPNASTEGTQPIYWNTFVSNSSTNTRYGIVNESRNPLGLRFNVIRDHSTTNTYLEGFFYKDQNAEPDSTIEFQIYDEYNGPLTFGFASSSLILPAQVKNQLFVKNGEVVDVVVE